MTAGAIPEIELLVMATVSAAVSAEPSTVIEVKPIGLVMLNAAAIPATLPAFPTNAVSSGPAIGDFPMMDVGPTVDCTFVELPPAPGVRTVRLDSLVYAIGKAASPVIELLVITEFRAVVSPLSSTIKAVEPELLVMLMGPAIPARVPPSAGARLPMVTVSAPLPPSMDRAPLVPWILT